MSNQPDGLYASFETNKGNILVSLEMDKTPLTVSNFVGLAEGTMNTSSRKGKPFYDGLNFHRVISKHNGDAQDFMIQGGDPLGNGTGDPGYRFADEFDPSLRFDKPGLLAMANSGPASNGSQFFITLVPTGHLNDRHTIFGKVVSGMETVQSIKTKDTITKITIIRKGSKAEAFRPDQASFDALAKTQTEREAKAKAERAKADSELAARIIPGAKQTKSGIYYKVEKAGNGDKPKRGQAVGVHYTGKLLDGTVFDSSIPRKQPITIAAGVGQVIPGWDEQLIEMELGEKRIVAIPPQLAYGEQGYPGAIPPNSWLVFEMELVSIGKK